MIGAGLSTAVGAAAVFFQRIVQLASKRVLAAGLGFSGGVMLYVSFIEIFVKSLGAFEADGREPKDAYFISTSCLFAGMAIMRLLAMLVHVLDKSHSHEASCCDMPEIRSNVMGKNEVPLESAEPEQKIITQVAVENAAGELVIAEEDEAVLADKEKSNVKTQEAPGITDQKQKDEVQAKKLQRMGLSTAAAIAIHNFPEGLATFVATLADTTVGATLAVAIAIHNIPEGLCVALPIYYASGSRLKGFMWALLSGISEPIGALIGYGIIKSTGDDMNQAVYGTLFGVVAGMMIMIVILELLPTAYRYDPTDTCVTNSLVIGMFVMAASLCLFQL